jgi:hypothetical protein
MGNHPLDFRSALWIIIQSARLLEEGSTRAICSQLTNKVGAIKKHDVAKLMGCYQSIFSLNESNTFLNNVLINP